MRLKIFTPPFWTMNEKYNEKVDSFYKNIIENRSEIRFIWANEPTLCFNYRNYLYTVWIDRKWSAYLTEINRRKLTALKLPSFYSNISLAVYLSMGRDYFLPNGRPSRETLINFYEKVELPAIQRLKEYGLYARYDGDKEGYDYVMLNGNAGKIIKTNGKIVFLSK